MRIIKILLIVSLALGAVAGGYGYWRTAFQPFESTENTYLKAHMSLISPRESGYVKAVLFEDNQKVRPGDLLAIIDDVDFRAKLAEGEAQILVEQAQINSLESDKRVQRSQVQAKEAEMAAVAADLERAAGDRKRFGNLVAEGAVSVQTRDAAEAAFKQTRAQLDKCRFARDEAVSRLSALEARIGEAAARIKAIQASLETLRIALSHTRIVAPIAGTLGNRSVQVGQYVKPGNVLAYLIPEEGLYVEANFKETQIEHMRPGQPVEIIVDAFPEAPFTGRVDSFAPASGAEFSLLPPENATGNFTKIVRRVPVRIAFEPGADLGNLRPGLSATARVRVQ
jgi:membrane fusion protein (multidrug efflux system)